MKIGFLSTHDPFTATSFSGVPYFMTNALRDQGATVDVIARRLIAEPSFGLLGRIQRKVFPKGEIPQARFAKEIIADLQKSPVDIVYAVMAANLVQYVPPNIPLVYFSDATAHLMRGYYAGGFDENAVELERKVYERADRIILTSQWAARSAIQDSGVNPDKIQVIPFGANIDRPPPASIVEGRRTTGTLKLLFIASHWERKGGPVALDALEALRAAGVDTQLYIVGKTGEHIPPGAEAVGYLNKAVPKQKQRLTDLIETCHFMLMPSRAETFGAVVGEVNAYGLPVVGAKTGGLAEAVIEGENGMTLDAEATGEEYARRILQVWRDPAAYESLVRGSRRTFDTRLAWSVVGRQTVETLQEAIDAQSSRMKLAGNA